MGEGLGPAFDVEVLATSLRKTHRETAGLVEFLAGHLEQSLPDRVTVNRGGFFLSSRRPIAELKARLDDSEFRLKRRGEGSYDFERADVVGGIAIRTHKVGLEEWMKGLLEALSTIASRDDEAARLLEKYR